MKRKKNRLGQVESRDKIKAFQLNFQKRLFNLLKDKLLPVDIYDIRPLGSLRAHLYECLKIKQNNIPVCPFLSMTEFVLHKLAKYMSELLKPVLGIHSKYISMDSFFFCKLYSKLSFLFPK